MLRNIFELATGAILQCFSKRLAAFGGIEGKLGTPYQYFPLPSLTGMIWSSNSRQQLDCKALGGRY
jgi:hypothetical protein